MQCQSIDHGPGETESDRTVETREPEVSDDGEGTQRQGSGLLHHKTDGRR